MAYALNVKRLAELVQGTTNISQSDPVWLLGTYYGVRDQDTERDMLVPEVLEAFKQDFASRVWCTYRKDFAPLGADGITTDVGWGCTLRSGQMLMAEALVRHMWGRSWQRPAGAAGDEAQGSELCELLSLLLDEPGPQAPLSIHNICTSGAPHGVVAGKWLGPWVLCKALEAAAQGAQGLRGLQLYVVCDPGGGAPALDPQHVRSMAFPQQASAVAEVPPRAEVAPAATAAELTRALEEPAAAAAAVAEAEAAPEQGAAVVEEPVAAEPRQVEVAAAEAEGAAATVAEIELVADPKAAEAEAAAAAAHAAAPAAAPPEAAAAEGMAGACEAAPAAAEQAEAAAGEAVESSGEQHAGTIGSSSTSSSFADAAGIEEPVAAPDTPSLTEQSSSSSSAAVQQHVPDDAEAGVDHQQTAQHEQQQQQPLEAAQHHPEQGAPPQGSQCQEQQQQQQQEGEQGQPQAAAGSSSGHSSRGSGLDGVGDAGGPADAAATSSGSGAGSGLLLLVPVTLGVGKVSPLYHPQIQAVLSLPHSVGIVGGRPGASLFFVGHQGSNLLYLDPHELQPRAQLPGGVGSYFCPTPRLMPITSMDPSLAVGLYCKNAGEFDDLCARLSALAQEHRGAPLITVCGPQERQRQRQHRSPRRTGGGQQQQAPGTEQGAVDGESDGGGGYGYYGDEDLEENEQLPCDGLIMSDDECSERGSPLRAASLRRQTAQQQGAAEGEDWEML